MLISRDVSQTSPSFTIDRTDDGVALNFSYSLAEDDQGDEESTWNGEIEAKLGDDTASATHDSEGPLLLTLNSEMADGVTYKGSYTLTDHTDDTELTFDFTVTSFLKEGDFQGKEAADYVLGSNLNDTLAGGDGDDVFMGFDGVDELNGEGGNDSIYAGDGDDVVDGGVGDDRLKGNRGADNINGGDGDDWIAGRLGADVLEGGAGADTFVFSTALSDDSADEIEDFTTGEDKIALNVNIFSALEGMKTLDGMHFAANADGEAAEADDLIVYNTTTGELFYDADGSGSGAAQLIATLKPGADLSETDFLIV